MIIDLTNVEIEVKSLTVQLEHHLKPYCMVVCYGLGQDTYLSLELLLPKMGNIEGFPLKLDLCLSNKFFFWTENDAY